MQRPTGITILAVLAVIGGAFAVLGGLAAMGIGGIALTPAVSSQAGADAGAMRTAGLLGVGGGGVLLIIGILDLILGWGFWALKPWAWILGVALQLLQVMQVVVSWLSGFNFTSLISLAIAGVILWYLFQPKIKQVFGRA